MEAEAAQPPPKRLNSEGDSERHPGWGWLVLLVPQPARGGLQQQWVN